MVKRFSIIFSIFLILLLSIFIVYSESNGIWHYAEDVVPGIFGDDQNNGNYIFEDPVIIRGASFNIQDDSFSTYLYANSTTGNIGIGTTNPNTKLDVNGNVNIQGNLLVNTIKSNSPNGNVVIQLG